MGKYLILIFVFITYIQNVNSQQLDPEMKKLIQEADSIYKSNIKKSRLYGVYIPKDMDEAFAELDRLSPPESLVKIKAANENVIAKKLHFGLGKWMSHNWNFDEGSRFSHYLRELGLRNSDEMIDFMLISYHRYLNKRDQEIEKRILIYQKKREDLKKKNEKDISPGKKD